MPDFPVVKPYEPTRSAFVSVKGTGLFLGMVGEFKDSVRKQMKLPTHVAGFEIGVKELADAIPDVSFYAPLSSYPGTQKDITLRIAVDTNYKEILFLTEEALQKENVEIIVAPVGIYQSEGDLTHKNITLRLYLTNHERTITTTEANTIIQHVVETAKVLIGAEHS